MNQRQLELETSVFKGGLKVIPASQMNDKTIKATFTTYGNMSGRFIIFTDNTIFIEMIDYDEAHEEIYGDGYKLRPLHTGRIKHMILNNEFGNTNTINQLSNYGIIDIQALQDYRDYMEHDKSIDIEKAQKEARRQQYLELKKEFEGE